MKFVFAIFILTIRILYATSLYEIDSNISIFQIDQKRHLLIRIGEDLYLDKDYSLLIFDKNKFDSLCINDYQRSNYEVWLRCLEKIPLSKKYHRLFIEKDGNRLEVSPSDIQLMFFSKMENDDIDDLDSIATNILLKNGYSGELLIQINRPATKSKHLTSEEISKLAKLGINPFAVQFLILLFDDSDDGSIFKEMKIHSLPEIFSLEEKSFDLFGKMVKTIVKSNLTNPNIIVFNKEKAILLMDTLISTYATEVQLDKEIPSIHIDDEIRSELLKSIVENLDNSNKPKLADSLIYLTKYKLIVGDTFKYDSTRISVLLRYIHNMYLTKINDTNDCFTKASFIDSILTFHSYPDSSWLLNQKTDFLYCHYVNMYNETLPYDTFSTAGFEKLLITINDIISYCNKQNTATWLSIKNETKFKYQVHLMTIQKKQTEEKKKVQIASLRRNLIRGTLYAIGIATFVYGFNTYVDDKDAGKEVIFSVPMSLGFAIVLGTAVLDKNGAFGGIPDNSF